MNHREFFKKYQLVDNENISAYDLTGFLYILDYLYCTRTKEQVIELVSDFYDNADNIFNSIAEEVKAKQDQQEESVEENKDLDA